MFGVRCLLSFADVALLAEGVDRNLVGQSGVQTGGVALLAEGVDRNFVKRPLQAVCDGRPPRGGRG